VPGPRYISHEEAVLESSKDPEYRRVYRLLKPRYDVVKELITLRRRQGISQEEFARRAHTHQSRISKIESADQDVTLSTLTKLADALDADVDIRLIPRQEEGFFAEVLSLCGESTGRTWSIEEQPVVFRVVEEFVR
jgi:transcriptional regulator with XRE-family HTH domain